jgi:nucleoside-diphosphate-sugar epimerase
MHLGGYGMNRKILVTGGNGFIGSHVVRKLLFNKEIPIILTRKKSNMWRISDLEGQIITFDSDEPGLDKIFDREEIDGVINLATFYKKEHSFEDIERMIDTNVKFPTKLLQLCEEHQVPIFITAGSYFQYGQNSIFNSKDTTDARDLYAATKNALTKIMEYYSSKREVTTVELILFTPYGEKDHNEKLIPYIIRNALENRFIDLTEGFQKLNLVYVEDIATAFINSLQLCESKSHIKLEIGNTRSYSIRDVVTVIEDILGTHINVRWNAIVSNKVLDSDSLVVLDPYDNERLLNWKPKYDIYTGLRKTIEYYKREFNAY